MIENLSEFVVEPGPQDYLVHCRITRNNKGIDHGNWYTDTANGQGVVAKHIFRILSRNYLWILNNSVFFP